MTAVLAAFLCGISEAAQPTNSPSFLFETPNARLGLLWGEPTTVQEDIREVGAYIERGELDNAEDRLRDALIRTPKNPDLLVLSGHVFTAKRQFFLAEDAWAQLAEQFPSNAWVQACWGGMLLRVERWEKADDVLSAARRMDPKELVARYNLACSRLHAKTQIPLWMLEGLTTDEIGRLATWIGDEPDTLIHMLTEDGYQVLCRAVLTGQTSVRRVSENADLTVLNQRMKDVARVIWEAHVAKQKEDWSTAARALEVAVSLGVTAPSIQTDLASCRAHLGQ